MKFGGAGVPLLCALWVAGCGTAKPSNQAPVEPPASEAAHDYYPLGPGWRWAYDVEKGGERILATYAVVEQLADTSIVQAGEERFAYALLPEGIARRRGMEIEDFILKTPVRRGARWAIAGGEATIVETGRTVTVPAGTFSNCALVEEHRSNPNRVIRTTYAAGTGPVSIEYQLQDPASGQFAVAVRAVLRGVTKPGDDPLGDPAPTRRP